MPAASPILDIPLRVSRCYGYTLGVLCGLTCLLVLLMPLAAPLRLLFMPLWLLTCWRAWANWINLRAVQRLQVTDTGLSLVVGGQEKDVVLGTHLLVTSWLVILPLKAERTTFLLPLLWDCADAVDLRRLRVWLHCRHVARVPPVKA